MDARLRDILLFVAGLGVLIHQTLVSESASSTLVGAAMAMMIGAPAVYRFLDHFDRRDQKEDE
jgi:uncharacterized membrane protein YobD (UPF0266 family)